MPRVNTHGTVSSKSCCVQPLESRLLCSDVYVGRPELLGPPSFPSTGPPPVLNAGGIDRIGEDGSKTTVVTNLHRPCGVAVDPAGNLYYVDVDDSAGGGTTRATLFRRSPAGDTADLGVVFDSGGGTVGIGGWAIDVVAGPSGVYVNRPEVRSRDNPDIVLSPGSIDQVDPDGTRAALGGGFRRPGAAAAPPEGSLFCVDVDYAPFRAKLFRRSPD